MEGLRHSASERTPQSKLCRRNGVRIRVFGPRMKAVRSLERCEYLEPSRPADAAVGRLPVNFTGNGIVRAISIAVFEVIGETIAVVIERRVEHGVAGVNPDLVGVGVTRIGPGGAVITVGRNAPEYHVAAGFGTEFHVPSFLTVLPEPLAGSYLRPPVRRIRRAAVG